jgi:hypothetical protein
VSFLDITEQSALLSCAVALAAFFEHITPSDLPHNRPIRKKADEES